MGKVVPAPLVMAGTSFTFSVKLCVAFGRAPLAAVNVRVCAPPVPAAGVPLNVPEPSPLSVNVTPVGSAPTVSAGVGVPTAATVKLPGDPTVKVVVLALV